jgi:hypothetical protein
VDPSFKDDPALADEVSDEETETGDEEASDDPQRPHD